jgi:polar amino acid transport system substrate-binding protein
VYRIKAKALLLLGLLSGWAIASESLPEATLVVGHWPPYITQARPGEGRLTREVFDIYHASGLEPQLLFDSWKNVVYMRLKKPHHLSFGWVDNERRRQKWHFSKPIMETPVGLWVRNDFDQIITDYTQLGAYLVGVGKHYSYGQNFEDNKHRFRRAEFTEEGEGFRLLIEGRIDAFIGDEAVGKYFLSRHKDWQKRVYFLETPIFESVQQHMICEKANPRCLDHLQRFNQALDHYRNR